MIRSYCKPKIIAIFNVTFVAKPTSVWSPTIAPSFEEVLRIHRGRHLGRCRQGVLATRRADTADAADAQKTRSAPRHAATQPPAIGTSTCRWVMSSLPVDWNTDTANPIADNFFPPQKS